jgi:Tfp pilus assembly protein PilF
MNDSKQLETLTALAEENERNRPLLPIIGGVRVSAAPYLALASVLTFVSALLVRAEHDFWGLGLVVTAWLCLPLLALADRIVFDGRGIRRHGPFASLLKLLLRTDGYLLVEDFETVETNAVRTLRRGGSVRYRYRTQIDGKGKQFVISSGGKSYRNLIRQLLPLVHDDKLDNRSRDLRDYLNDPRIVSQKAQLSTLASADILELAKSDFRLGGKQLDRKQESDSIPSREDLERAHLLRRLGNELRVAGRLREAGEAFRRALNVTPHAAWLIYDFGRLLRSQAGAQSNAKLLSRARAALRLASIKAQNDLNLLPLIGESFLECGDSKQARKVLQRVVDADSGNFKARMSLADIALRDGKLAYVIHHYHEAGRANAEDALARYARREADYYMTLNNHDDYLVAELRRISWLQNAGRVRRLAARVTNAAVLLALLGSFIDPLASSIGWSLATSSLVIWLITVALTRALYKRAKPRIAS